MRRNLLGRKFGRLTVIDTADDLISNSGYHTVMWKCQCECGNIVTVRGKSLTGGVTKSCGCYQKDGLSDRASKHNGYGSRLYTIWNSMRQRCNNPNNNAYHNYGGRGITICDEWDDYAKFRDWAINSGYDKSAPRGELTLDRIDVNKGYSPDNCRWADVKRQSNNRRNTIYLEHNGKTLSLSEWASLTGIKYATLWKRYSRGLPVEQVLSEAK